MDLRKVSDEVLLKVLVKKQVQEASRHGLEYLQDEWDRRLQKAKKTAQKARKAAKKAMRKVVKEALKNGTKEKSK